MERDDALPEVELGAQPPVPRGRDLLAELDLLERALVVELAEEVPRGGEVGGRGVGLGQRREQEGEGHRSHRHREMSVSSKLFGSKVSVAGVGPLFASSRATWNTASAVGSSRAMKPT